MMEMLVHCTFDFGLSADQCALLEEYGLLFNWRALSDPAYSDLANGHSKCNASE